MQSTPLANGHKSHNVLTFCLFWHKHLKPLVVFCFCVMSGECQSKHFHLTCVTLLPLPEVGIMLLTQNQLIHSHWLHKHCECGVGSPCNTNPVISCCHTALKWKTLLTVLLTEPFCLCQTTFGVNGLAQKPFVAQPTCQL